MKHFYVVSIFAAAAIGGAFILLTHAPSASSILNPACFSVEGMQ